MHSKPPHPGIPYTGVTVICYPVVCYIDAFSGLAGDMLVAALADAGADREAITHALKSLATEGEFAWEQVKRRGMAAAKFRVTVTETPKHRHLSGILKIIAAADLPDPVKAASGRVFQVLAEAESNRPRHQHRKGPLSRSRRGSIPICDIVGICMGLHLLNVDKIYCSAINVGSGTVNTEHGVLPVPAPATARLLEGKPIYARGPAELTTPTGAVQSSQHLPTDSAPCLPMSISSIGYGAGDYDFKEHANIVRVILARGLTTTAAPAPPSP